MDQMVSIPVTQLLKVERGVGIAQGMIEWDCRLCRVGSRTDTMEQAVAGFHGHLIKNHHAVVID